MTDSDGPEGSLRPIDPLTELADRMLEVLKADPELGEQALAMDLVLCVSDRTGAGTGVYVGASGPAADEPPLLHAYAVMAHALGMQLRSVLLLYPTLEPMMRGWIFGSNGL